MNNTNDQNTATTNYCTCYVKRQVNRTIHVCRKCGLRIYKQDTLTAKQIVIIIALLTACYFAMAWLQANGATP